MENCVNNDEVSAVANNDPHLELIAGEKLTFAAKRLFFEGSNGDYMPVGSQLGILLALSFRDDSGHHTTGSAAMVGPGLAVCAAHVLQDQGYAEKLASGETTLVAQAPLPGGMLLWTVLRFSLVPNADLAVLSLTLSSSFPENRHFDFASITTRMPAVGDELTITGLSAIRRTEAVSSATHLEMVPGCVKGLVIDSYPEGRDRAMLPGPCFAVDCDARGGMSGGPVFDSRGHLVGVVSSSYEGGATTFVSHVWPALVRADACPVWPIEPYPLPATGTLLHLGRRFGISIDRPDAFKLCAFNGEVALSYEAWQ